MMLSGFIYDTVDKMKKLPTRESKFKSSGKFKSGLQPRNTCNQNIRKLKVKKISESELEEVISKIRLDAQREKRKRRVLLLLLVILAAILMLCFIFFGLEPLLELHNYIYSIPRSL
jgi:hypothetical protein